MGWLLAQRRRSSSSTLGLRTMPQEWRWKVSCACSSAVYRKSSRQPGRRFWPAGWGTWSTAIIAGSLGDLAGDGGGVANHSLLHWRRCLGWWLADLATE